MISRYFSTKSIAPIKITSKAWNKIISIISNTDKYFLFSAKGGGCSGFNYNLSLIDKNEIHRLNKTNFKACYIEKNGTKVYIDPLSEMYLLDTEIDYISEDLDKNIFENKFLFIPDKNKATTCGCGISFSPK